jgi:uncharacterized protein (DUF362 family)
LALQVSDFPAIGSFERILKVDGTLDALAGLDVLCLPFENTKKVDIGKPYGDIDIAREAVDADLIINLPKLKTHSNTKSHSLANFVGFVVGFLNVLLIRLRSLLLAASLSFECNLL